MKRGWIAVFLWVLLAGWGKAEELTVINAGVGGNSTHNLLQRVDKDVLAHKPDVVVMMVGTNDALNSRNSVPLEEYRKNLRDLVEKFKNSGAKVLLLTIPPAYDKLLLSRHRAEFFADRSPAQRIADVNAVVKGMGKLDGVTVVDVHARIEEKGGAGPEATSLIRNPANSKSKDGVHPTSGGYDVIAAAVYRAMKDAGWDKVQTVVCFGDSITYGAAMKGAGTAAADADTYPAKLARLLK